MKKTFKITKIRYFIEDYDVEEVLKDEGYEASIDEAGYLYYDYEVMKEKRQEIQDSLPSELTVEIDTDIYPIDDGYVLEDLLNDEISDETGWLVEDYWFEEVK